MKSASVSPERAMVVSQAASSGTAAAPAEEEPELVA